MTTLKNKYHHGDLRRKLLAEAAKIIELGGMKSLSIRKLSERVGVSHAAPYHHFSGKGDLLCALAQDGFNRQFQLLEDSHETDNLEQAIRRFVYSYITFATDYPQYYDLMLGQDIWKAGKPTKELTDSAHGSFSSYVSRVNRWQKNGLISENIDPLRYAQTSWSTLHGLSRLIIDGIYVDTSSKHHICNFAIKMFLNCLIEQPQKDNPQHIT